MLYLLGFLDLFVNLRNPKIAITVRQLGGVSAAITIGALQYANRLANNG